jgi:hypothetical protein
VGTNKKIMRKWLLGHLSAYHSPLLSPFIFYIHFLLLLFVINIALSNVFLIKFSSFCISNFSIQKNIKGHLNRLN